MPMPCLPEAPTAQQRLCETCYHTFPLGEFRRRKRDSDHRMRQCRRCHNEFERYRRAAIRARLSKRRMAKDLASVRQTASTNRLKALCAAMVRGYGGAEQFCEKWRTCLERDLERGGMPALRHLEATIRLIQACEAERPDYQRMTDEELELTRIAALVQLTG
jgi:hypothetical protein